MLRELTDHLTVVTHAPLLLVANKLVSPLSVLGHLLHRPNGFLLSFLDGFQFELLLLFLLLRPTLQHPLEFAYPLSLGLLGTLAGTDEACERCLLGSCGLWQCGCKIGRSEGHMIPRRVPQPLRSILNYENFCLEEPPASLVRWLMISCLVGT